MLGALPDSLIILTSLSSASQAEAQEAVAVGIGESGAGGMAHVCCGGSQHCAEIHRWACRLCACCALFRVMTGMAFIMRAWLTSQLQVLM